jgi:Outer membrane protein beta-barrel domain
MNLISAAIRCLGISVVVVAYVATSNVSRSYAETYIAGQFGVTLPSVLPSSFDNGLTNANTTGTLGTITQGGAISDQSLQSSILYGGKIGHYFKAVPWFGLELEVYNTTPHIKQQTIQFYGPSGLIGETNFAGLNFRVLTVAPFNVMFRLPKTRLQPYIGVGPGIFLARIEDPALTSGNTQSSTGFGLNAQAGVRYYITRQVALFGEGKFNYTKFSFDETPTGAFNLFGFDANYRIFHAVFGLSFHF